jgi:hypothetical protein
MNIGDLKLGIINLSTLAISMSHVDMVLKITLLVITIFYTLNKWWIEHKNRKNKKNK